MRPTFYPLSQPHEVTTPAFPDRRPVFFIGSLSNAAATPENPNGLNDNWLSPPGPLPGWLFGVINEGAGECKRILLRTPAGGPTSPFKWAHWETLTAAQQAEMTGASQTWLGLNPDGEIGVYVGAGQGISPPDTLEASAHEFPTITEEHQQWVTDSVRPYSQIGFRSFGFDAATALGEPGYGNILQMMDIAVLSPTKYINEAIKVLSGPPDQVWASSNPQICQLTFLTGPGARLIDPVWNFDPAQTEVHVILTAGEATDGIQGNPNVPDFTGPELVAHLAARGYIVGCRNQWWL